MTDQKSSTDTKKEWSEISIIFVALLLSGIAAVSVVWAQLPPPSGQEITITVSPDGLTYSQGMTKGQILREYGFMLLTLWLFMGLAAYATLKKLNPSSY